MRIGLGAVQFGVDYGISNKGGKTPEAEVAGILQSAEGLGIRIVDTASLYGNSEEALGRTMRPGAHFDIVTKTPVFDKQSIVDEDVRHLEEIFRASLSKLGRPAIYGLLIHRADDLLVPGGEKLMERMSRLKQDGVVEKIGVSVYSCQQIDKLLGRFPMDLIQLPINVLDQRLLQSGHLRKLKQAEVEIHARSVFLQGLLLMGLKEVPDYFESIRGRLGSYHHFVRENNLTLLQAAIGFVSSIAEIDCLICGINNQQQLHEIYEAAQAEVRHEDFADFAVMDEAILNPARWKLG